MARMTPRAQYLLIGVYPITRIPFGLFDTAEEALQFAASHPLAERGDDFGSELQERWVNVYGGFIDLDREENKRPCGYVIQKYENGVPTVYARVQPFAEREPVLPSDPRTTGDIDPEQDLDWV